MKKLLFISTALFISIFMCIQTADAQRISAGGGVGFGSQSEDLNFSVNAYHRLSTLPMRIGGDVGYTRPRSSGNVQRDLIDGNMNVHFMALDKELVSIYSITGLNVLHTITRTENDETLRDNHTDLGMNLGAGGELYLGGNAGRVFGEVKYIVGSEREDQWMFGAGVRVNVGN